MQVVWIWSHVMKKVGLLPEHMPSHGPLSHYIDLVLLQRDISWPSPTAGYDNFVLTRDGTLTEIHFHTTQTVDQLLRAEATLSNTTAELAVVCEGHVLPPYAFLQERTYEICRGTHASDQPIEWVPLTVVFLGQVTAYWA